MTPARLLPSIASIAEYRLVVREAGVWLSAMRAIQQRHGLSGRLKMCPPASNVVFGVGADLIIKLYPSLWREDEIPDRLLMEHLDGKLAVPTPRLVASGEIDGWPYLVMTRLEGQMLGQVWRRVPPVDQRAIVEQLGALMAQLHAAPLAGLGALAVDWDAFMADRRAECIEKQRGFGMTEPWLDDLAAFIAALPPLHPPAPRCVLMSADITADHVMLAERGGRWRAVGFFDFGDAMIGHHLYEFAAPAAFITRGNPALLKALFESYGTPSAEIDEGLSRRLAGYVVLHRFSNIPALAQRTERSAPLPDLAAFLGETCALPPR